MRLARSAIDYNKNYPIGNKKLTAYRAIRMAEAMHDMNRYYMKYYNAIKS